jgi:hypothetical protein
MRGCRMEQTEPMSLHLEKSRANFLGFSRSLMSPGTEICRREHESFLLVDTGAETGLNRIVVNRVFREADRAQFDELLRHFRDSRRMFSVVIPEGYATQEFLGVASDRNLSTGSMLTWPVMVRARPSAQGASDSPGFPRVPPLPSSPTEGCVIRRAEDPESMERWSRVVSDAFTTTPERNEILRHHLLQYCSNDPNHFYYYLVDPGGAPASSAAIFRDDVSDTLGLYWVATSRAERGKGYARALNEWIMDAHGAADDVYLQATGAGVKLYESLGFLTINRYRIFIPARAFFATPSRHEFDPSTRR